MLQSPSLEVGRGGTITRRRKTSNEDDCFLGCTACRLVRCRRTEVYTSHRLLGPVPGWCEHSNKPLVLQNSWEIAWAAEGLVVLLSHEVSVLFVVLQLGL
jgi:hypothetical protein